MKKSYSLLELIFVVSILIIILGVLSFYKSFDNKLLDASNRIILYLKQTRYQALIDDKTNKEENLWHKKRWTLKFFRCRKDIGGIYYVIYSDENMTGHPNLEESLSDPLTKKKIYSTNKCEFSQNTSKYVLLTKEYNIKEVNISCNSTESIGQISFGKTGKVYSKLSNYENQEDEFEIKEKCKIELKSLNGGISTIIVEPNTAYAYEQKSGNSKI